VVPGSNPDSDHKILSLDFVIQVRQHHYGLLNIHQNILMFVSIYCVVYSARRTRIDTFIPLMYIEMGANTLLLATSSQDRGFAFYKQRFNLPVAGHINDRETLRHRHRHKCACIYIHDCTSICVWAYISIYTRT